MKKLLDRLSQWRLDSLSLKTRFALVSVALFLFSVWGMAGYVANELKDDMEDLLAEQQRAMANSIAQAIITSVRVRRESLVMTAGDIAPGLLRDIGALTDQLDERQAMHRLFDVALFVTAPTGERLAGYPSQSAVPDLHVNQRGLIGEIIEKKQFSIGLPEVNSFDQRAGVPFGAPILGKGGDVKGMLFGITSLLTTEFVDQASNLASDIGYVVISKSNRLILASQDKSLIMRPAAAPGADQLLDRFLAGYEGSGITVNARGIEELNSAKGVKGTEWVVVVSIPSENAFEPVSQMRRRIFASTAMLSLVVALLTWLFVRRTLRPLEDLVENVGTMGTPDSPPRQLEPKPSVPEIGKLVGALNRMQMRIAEQAKVLRENEARFHFVADHSPMLIWISDETGQRVWFNQTWLKTTAQTFEQSPSVSWERNIHADDLERYVESSRRGMSARATIRTQYRLRDSSGGYRWFFEIAVPRIIEGDKLAGYVGSCLDIDEQVAAQRKAETLLRENRTLMAERFNVEEAERQRLARDLHDDLGQWLTAIHANAEAICVIASEEGQARVHHCASSIVTSTSAIQDCVRALNRKFGSDTLATLGLKDSLEELVNGWREYQVDIVTELTLDDDIGKLDSQIETAVFRLVQEAVTNVARHAKATRVDVDLRRQHTIHGDELLLSITDDGIGFDFEGDSRGVGLIGMRERTVALGGGCDIFTEPGRGTRVEVRIPLLDESPRQASGNGHTSL